MGLLNRGKGLHFGVGGATCWSGRAYLLEWVGLVGLPSFGCLSTGTAAAIMWKLKVIGRLFHSGLPHKGINSVELAMDAITYIQNRFYQDFPAVRTTAVVSSTFYH